MVQRRVKKKISSRFVHVFVFFFIRWKLLLFGFLNNYRSTQLPHILQKATAGASCIMYPSDEKKVSALQIYVNKWLFCSDATLWLSCLVQGNSKGSGWKYSIYKRWGTYSIYVYIYSISLFFELYIWAFWDIFVCNL